MRLMWRLPLLCLLLWAGCIGESPEQRLVSDLGPEAPGVPTGPNHRPGQPCLACHGEGQQEEPTFLVAGTIFERPGDERGARNVRVELQDAEGQAVTTRSNGAGNFYLSPRGAAADLVFPLRVTISRDGASQDMRGLIWREGSCAACHGGGPSAENNGRVYLQGDTP